MSMFQPFSIWFQVELKNFEVVLLFHYSIWFMQHAGTTGRKTAPENDATTTMLDSWCSVLRLENLTFTPPKVPDVCCAQIAQSLSCLTIKRFSRSHLACPCGTRVKEFDFGAGDSSLAGPFSAHGYVKLISPWTATLMFQEFLVHGRLNLGRSWVVLEQLNQFHLRISSLNWSRNLQLFRNGSVKSDLFKVPTSTQLKIHGLCLKTRSIQGNQIS